MIKQNYCTYRKGTFCSRYNHICTVPLCKTGKDKTMKEIDRAIEVLQAYKEGKEVEYYANEMWQPLTDRIMYKLAYHECRVKPTKKYRPYISVEEFLQASKYHGPYLRVINDKGTYQTYVLPLAIVGAWIDFNGVISDNDIKHESVPYTKLLGKYVWQDGTPCGIKEN